MSKLHPRASRYRRGFTLMELMISLVMGLIVALAAVGLARTATTTFHEQARSSVTEMGVRAGAERLRQDLMRISYMSTGNIVTDPRVAHIQGANDAAGRARYTQLQDLRGIRVEVNGVGGVVPPVAQRNGLSPDSIVISGNLTTDDAYAGTISTGGTCPNGQVVRLDPLADAAVYHLAGGAATTAALFTASATAAFVPVAGSVFLAQVTDAMGCTHYAPVCGIQVVAGTVAPNNVLLVSLQGGSNRRAVLYSNSPPLEYENPPGLANSCGSSEGGKVSISPIMRVRWALTPTPTALTADPAVEAAGLKYDLTRQVLDWDAEPIPNTQPEIVTEYAVDLKFGIAVDDPAIVAPNNPLRIFDLDSDNGTGSIMTTTNTGTLPLGPQRVRSVRYRVAVRTSVADREQNLVVGPAPYLSRYCADTVALAACKKWSRVRTIVSEVALHNQARMNY